MSSRALAVLAYRLRQERLARGWTMRTLARQAGTAQSTVCKAEAGPNDVSLLVAEKWATALGIPLTSLLTMPHCAHCHGKVPDGFTCNACGRTGGDAA